LQIHHLWNKFSSCAQRVQKLNWGNDRSPGPFGVEKGLVK
jgi:hypothetical protein